MSIDFKEKSHNKIVHPEELSKIIAELRDQGKTIATLNGSFDLMHAGHLHIIHEAAKQADVLIIALNSDASINTYKGSSRPIIPLKYRLEMIGALEGVSYTTWFEETDPRAILSVIQPDVHVNGSEYGNNCIEANTVLSYGGRLHIVDRIPGLATSEIIKKIKNLCD